MIWIIGYVVISIAAAYYCYSLGFWLSLVEIIGMITATSVALLILHPVAVLTRHLPMPAASVFAAMALIMSWVAMQWLMFRLLGQLLSRLPKSWQLSKINKLAGSVLGVAWALAVVVIVLFTGLSLPLNYRWKAAIRCAPLVKGVVVLVGNRQDSISAMVSSNLLQPLGLISLKSEIDDRVVALSFKTTDTLPAPNLEQQMLGMLNEERRKAGLKPLMVDAGLLTAARSHCVDMLKAGYFAHTDPAGHDPFWRITSAHVDYLAAGENLALAPSLDVAHNGLMNSPEHRANILSTSYGRVGIGVLDAGKYGLMITQDFAD